MLVAKNVFRLHIIFIWLEYLVQTIINVYLESDLMLRYSTLACNGSPISLTESTDCKEEEKYSLRHISSLNEVFLQSCGILIQIYYTVDRKVPSCFSDVRIVKRLLTHYKRSPSFAHLPVDSLFEDCWDLKPFLFSLMV